MNQWTAPQRPNSYAEHMLINAILDGNFPPGSNLPGERDLAVQLGVTRPTLREAIQRLARDGWLTVQQGKPTAVNNIWQDGGLNVLSGLVRHSEHLPPGFITNLLEVRLHLAPAYTARAVALAAAVLAEFLQSQATLPDEPAAFARFDWQLHRLLTQQCGNPIYGLILNGFTDFYEQLARLYFALPDSRAASQAYYAALASAVTQQDAALAETVTRQAMQQSMELWQAARGNSGQ
ncbi:MAG TPA: fatty acid metabolism transcriptional regulator FadR [Chloroflexota bacterium]|nr:fatty acid metabolism transcriptional regulator FadR [Chloroflexota bacterium]